VQSHRVLVLAPIATAQKPKPRKTPLAQPRWHHHHISRAHVRKGEEFTGLYLPQRHVTQRAGLLRAAKRIGRAAMCEPRAVVKQLVAVAIYVKDDKKVNEPTIVTPHASSLLEGRQLAYLRTRCIAGLQGRCHYSVVRSEEVHYLRLCRRAAAPQEGVKQVDGASLSAMPVRN
jgi:hypothetical protein